jgi:hypothetical protein
MTKIPVPKPGFSLVDLCRLCAEHKVIMHIGVAGVHVDAVPATITIQFTSGMQSEPEYFAVELPVDKPHLNLGISSLVADAIAKMSMKPRIQLVN